MKKLKPLLCVVLFASVVLCTATKDTYAGTSISSITNDSIREKQKQISESENLKKQLQANLTDAKAIKAELEALKKDLANYLYKLDEEITALQGKIEEYKVLIAEKEVEIEQITQELNEAIAVEEAQYAAMKARIKFMYEKGDSLYLEIMLSAHGFGDFLTKADYIDMLEEYDRKMLDEYKATREWTELVKQDLEAQKSLLDETKASLESEEASLRELMDEKEQQMNEYTAQINSRANQISNYEAELEDQTNIIEALEAAILAEQKAIAAANGVVLNYDGGKFTWPAPSYIKIFDDFGWRTDPFTNVSAYHSGIDMAAPGGSKILAAYDGVVVAAAWNYSMGNYIMINHGDGLYTIYMHASALHVKVDDVVVRGEHIANVGSTGRSTGNHLHFGVRLNGSYVSPWPYLGVN